MNIKILAVLDRINERNIGSFGAMALVWSLMALIYVNKIEIVDVVLIVIQVSVVAIQVACLIRLYTKE